MFGKNTVTRIIEKSIVISVDNPTKLRSKNQYAFLALISKNPKSSVIFSIKLERTHGMANIPISVQP